MLFEVQLNRRAVVVGIRDNGYRHECDCLRMDENVLVENNDGIGWRWAEFVQVGNEGNGSEGWMDGPGFTAVISSKAEAPVVQAPRQ